MFDNESTHQSAFQNNKTISSVFGEIIWLMSRSTNHRDIKLSDLERLVMPPILLRKMRLFYDGDQPVAAVLYAHVSANVGSRLDSGTSITELTAEDWKSGETLRVMLTIAPLGGSEIYEQETLNVLGNKAANASP